VLLRGRYVGQHGIALLRDRRKDAHDPALHVPRERARELDHRIDMAAEQVRNHLGGSIGHIEDLDARGSEQRD